MEINSGQKLAEETWQMRDHRNSVNNDSEAATMSIEVNQLSEKHNRGSENSSGAARELAQQPKELLDEMIELQTTMGYGRLKPIVTTKQQQKAINKYQNIS